MASMINGRLVPHAIKTLEGFRKDPRRCLIGGHPPTPWWALDQRQQSDREALRRGTGIETRKVYETVLANMPVHTARCNGLVPDADRRLCWLFFEMRVTSCTL